MQKKAIVGPKRVALKRSQQSVKATQMTETIEVGALHTAIEERARLDMELRLLKAENATVREMYCEAQTQLLELKRQLMRKKD